MQRGEINSLRGARRVGPLASLTTVREGVVSFVTRRDGKRGIDTSDSKGEMELYSSIGLTCFSA